MFQEIKPKSIHSTMPSRDILYWIWPTPFHLPCFLLCLAFHHGTLFLSGKRKPLAIITLLMCQLSSISFHLYLIHSHGKCHPITVLSPAFQPFRISLRSLSFLSFQFFSFCSSFQVANPLSHIRFHIGFAYRSLSPSVPVFSSRENVLRTFSLSRKKVVSW